MIAMQNLLDMICTEAFEGNNGDTCRDYGHELPLPGERLTNRIDRYVELEAFVARQERIAKHLDRKLTSLKSKLRAQRRLDRTSIVRHVKRRAELARRKSTRIRLTS